MSSLLLASSTSMCGKSAFHLQSPNSFTTLHGITTGISINEILRAKNRTRTCRLLRKGSSWTNYCSTPLSPENHRTFSKTRISTPVERNSCDSSFQEDILSTSHRTLLLPPNFEKPSLSRVHSAQYSKKLHELTVHLPTFFTGLPRLPFAPGACPLLDAHPFHERAQPDYWRLTICRRFMHWKG